MIYCVIASIHTYLLSTVARFSAQVKALHWRRYLRFLLQYSRTCRLGSVVSIATGYRLDGPRIESWWGQDFLHLSRLALGPTQPPVQWVLGLSQGKERPRHDTDSSPPSSAVGHERVELYLCSPCGPYGLYRASVPVQGCTLPVFTLQNILTSKRHVTDGIAK
jgi:hypothetical protein